MPGTGEEAERDQAEEDDEQQRRVAGAVDPLQQEQPAEADEQHDEGPDEDSDVPASGPDLESAASHWRRLLPRTRPSGAAQLADRRAPAAADDVLPFERVRGDQCRRHQRGLDAAQHARHGSRPGRGGGLRPVPVHLHRCALRRQALAGGRTAGPGRDALGRVGRLCAADLPDARPDRREGSRLAADRVGLRGGRHDRRAR